MRPPNDASVDDRCKLLKLLNATLVVSFGGVGITPTKDRILKVLPESCGCTKNPLVDKVDERKVLKEIILDRCSGEQNSTLGFKAHQRLVSLIFGVLESVPFVAEDKTDLSLVKDCGVQTESFVGQNLYENHLKSLKRVDFLLVYFSLKLVNSRFTYFGLFLKTI